MLDASDALTPEQKFSKDGPFRDPVVRCDRCQKLLLVEQLKKLGMCPKCSNIRVANVRTFDGDELIAMQQWAADGKIDGDFLKLFEVID